MRKRINGLCGLGAAGMLLAALSCGCGERGGGGGGDLEQGLRLLRQGSYEGALHKLERAVHAAPGNATAQCNLGIVCWKMGRPDQALEALRKASLLDPADPRPRQFLGQLLISGQRWNEAHDTLKRLNELTPDSPWVLTSLAVVTYNRNENSNTQLLLAKALGIDPAYPPALYNMAIFSRDRLKQPEAAADFFQRYLKVAGDDPHAGSARAALAALTKPSSEPSGPKPSVPAPARPSAAVSGQATGEHKPAAPAAQPAPESKPKPPAPVAPKPSVDGERAASAAQLVSRAQRAVERDAFDEALVMLQQAAGIDPRNADALWQLAELYEKRLGYAEKAADVYARFRREFPDDPRAKGAAPAAPPASAIQKPPASMGTAREAWIAGQISHREGNLAAAALYYKRALALDERNTDAAFNLGLILKKDGQLVAARDAFLQALRFNPGHAEAGYMVALVYRDLGERKKAVAQVKKTLRVKPDYAAARLLFGLLFMDERDYAAAREQFVMALRASPDAQFAAKARTFLRNAERAAEEEP